jgi:oxygen-independent coproporphyrinogen III oxidase
LTLEEETPMQRMINECEIPAIDPDLSADQYEIAEDILCKNGYTHYEISNWAKPGKECRHNLVYWHNLPYLGAGVAAHSCLNGHRLANTGNLDEYLAEFSGHTGWKPEMDEIIGHDLEIAETIILGLRLDEGIQKEALRARFGINILDKFRRQITEMTDAGLLKQNDGCISLTRRGRLLSNQVFYRFLPEEQS